MEYNPFDPAVVRNPYPTYAVLRREAPVYRTALDFAAVSRYADVLHVLRSPELFSSSAMRDLIDRVKETSPDADEIRGGETLLGTDPPAHTRLRKIVNRAFTPRRIAGLEGRIREIASQLVDEFADEGECELMDDFAASLPVTIISEILGIDPAMRRDFKRWSDELIQAMDGAPSPELQLRLDRSFLERKAYVDEVVAERRRSPRDDVISALVQAEQDENVMTEHEIGNFIVLLLIAGNETTTNLIGNAVLALLDHPQDLAKVSGDLSLVPNVVEETLRYDSPVQLMLRRATRETELSGVTISEGETVAVLLGSANRDERQFADADRFDLTRDKTPHLAFGFGTHFCLGAGLARLEARMALETLLGRLRLQELTDRSIERAPSLIVRGPRRLDLRFSPR
ncbi:MAG: cytochrome P450 [Proteobacteria bacterium]|nr:cytochrome P450 [Pseudomonadota bacterium]